MSRFKFRIWDKTKNEWLGTSDKNSVIFRNFDLCGQTLRIQQLPMDIDDESKYLIEEFSDLFDYGGNHPIYEGDFVQTDGGEVGLVTFIESLWSIEWDRVNDSHLFDFALENEIQVIGNIHENPELLPKALRGLYA